MALNFPDTTGQPTNGTFTYTSGGTTWAWNGTTWKSQPAGTQFLDGSESAPSISFSSNQSSGLYSPITNSLGIVTNGTEAVRITSGGKFGIGNNNPGDYDTTANNLVVGEAGSGDRGITIASGTSSRGTIIFADGTSGLSEYAGYIQYNHNGDYLAIATNNSEALRIDSSGKIGIYTGTDTPDARLEVRDNASQGIIVRSTSTQATDTNKALRVRNNSDTNTFHVSHKGQGYFAGNVGVGADSPSQRLQIQGAGSQYASVVSTDSGNTGVLFGDSDRVDSGYILYANSTDTLSLGTGGNASTGPSQVVTITSTKRIGINHTNPLTDFVIANNNSGGVGPILAIVNGATGAAGNEAAIVFGVDSSGYAVSGGSAGDVANASIAAINTGTSNNTDLELRTYNSGQSGLLAGVTVASEGGLRLPNSSFIKFGRDSANTSFTTYIGTDDYPDAGYSGVDNQYWVKLASFGGTHVVVNEDGSYNSGRNNFDHFTVWQKDSSEISNSGRRLFSVDNIGGAQFGQAGIRIDRGWGNYPSISIQTNCNNGTSNATLAEFRIHGIGTTHASWSGGAGGTDFSANLRIDGGTYHSSDRRHKTNIVDNPYGLDSILQLQPRKFNRINSSGEIEENHGDILGFIAQEVMEIIPEAVKYYADEDEPNENGFCRAYSLSDGYIVSTLVNAVKELSAKNDALEARIAALEGS